MPPTLPVFASLLSHAPSSCYSSPTPRACLKERVRPLHSVQHGQLLRHRGAASRHEVGKVLLKPRPRPRVEAGAVLSQGGLELVQVELCEKPTPLEKRHPPSKQSIRQIQTQLGREEGRTKSERSGRGEGVGRAHLLPAALTRHAVEFKQFRK